MPLNSNVVFRYLKTLLALNLACNIINPILIDK